MESVEQESFLKYQNEMLLAENKRLQRVICDLRKKTSFKVYEENLRLVQEIESWKEPIKGAKSNEQTINDR